MKQLQSFLKKGLGRYALFVLLPTVLVLFYLSVIASDGFVSRAQLMVEQDSSVAASGAELALGLLSGSSGKSKQDALLVDTFLKSRTLLAKLDAELNLKAHFSSPEIDRLSRLKNNSSSAEFLDFYREHLIVAIDDDALILELEFVAHEPHYAQQVVQAMVKHTEIFVNDVSKYLARDQLGFVQEQVDRANERLKQASREMILLQRQTEVLSPEQETLAVGEILAGLEVELAKQRTHLKALAGYLNPAAPEMISVQNRVSALEAQLAQERTRMVGGKGHGLNDLMLEFQDAEVGVRVATELYKSALASLEMTRLDATRKVKYLVSVDNPSLPDSSEKPRVWYWTLTLWVFFTLAYFVVNLTIATIQDHRE